MKFLVTLLITTNQLKYLGYILLFCFSTLKAQNLITNPSFEDIDSCYGQPAGIGFDVFKWSGCKGWSNPIKSSSDLWCQNPIVGNTVPPNTITYQKPRTGENMVGLLINSGNVVSYREFIQNEIEDPLVSGKTYKISFYYSLGWGSESGYCPANQFGVYGSTTLVKDTSAYWLSQLSPLGVSDGINFIDDTLNWSSCEITFTASGGERFLTIGNFQDSTNTTFNEPCDTNLWNGISYAGAYYYLDDFSLNEYFDFEIPNVFTPNGDGVNDFVSFPNFGNSANKIVVVNRWGNLIYESNGINPIWDGKDTSGKNCTEGTYFYRINNTNIQGFIQLMR
ncbi:MAG: gliding motility-associated C-terminal domain-containing protein [Crocinitomicaceae bacterium]|nr:gliding motility-associated C-terminal domain-containing protein [Crocinitomicaceae bacterium]MCF8410935.1 gliding motility-associated C-terminal domain-containing protein [Crocinitomicaceae bacterium]MCF8444849.1 gliding motility-associated C-terminal domain-containing protein [Crocinitomicaceae bacterium]